MTALAWDNALAVCVETGDDVVPLAVFRDEADAQMFVDRCADGRTFRIGLATPTGEGDAA